MWRVILFTMLILTAGCSQAPRYVSCKGKATVTGQTSVMVYAGSFTLTGDCGEAFEYSTVAPAP